jgi:hypothetical protein
MFYSDNQSFMHFGMFCDTSLNIIILKYREVKIMKKLLVILVAVLFCMPGFSGNDWMQTGHGKIDCKRINLRLNKANIVLEDGQKMAVNYSDVNSFSQDGKVYVKLRLFEENKPTNKMAFMELMGTWNNLKLVKLSVRNIGSGSEDESSRYYLYDGSKFHLQLDDRTLKNTCETFGLDPDKI